MVSPTKSASDADATHFDTTKHAVVHSEWYKGLVIYEKPNHTKATLQVLDTLVPYFALWAVMVWLLKHNYSYWYLIPLLVVASGLTVRIFIIFHDCGHGSFTSNRNANTILGYITGILTFTPYYEWRHEHAEHHAEVGDLDRRGTGDIWTMTVQEFQTADKKVRLGYQLIRNPLILFTVGAPFKFLVLQRIPSKNEGKREKASVWITNFGILAIGLIAAKTIGFSTYIAIQFPIILLASIAGVWMFYVQHQYEHVYWAKHSSWDPIRAALEGSSYYKLPKVLQWFSGNIGLHHIHHLKPRIANYNLQRCFNEVAELRNVEIMTFSTSLKSLFYNLWDENTGKMVSFRMVKQMSRQA